MKPDDLHRRFVARLDAISLDVRHLPLVRRMVDEIGKVTSQAAGVERRRLSRELGDLEEKERRLRDLYIYQSAIERNVFEEEQQQLQEQRRLIDDRRSRISVPAQADLDRTLTMCERVL